MTENEIWKKCRAMLEWVAEHYEEYDTVEDAKDAYFDMMEIVGDDIPDHGCYFCEDTKFVCSQCLAVKIDPDFSCYANGPDNPYHYFHHPKEFLAKIIELDTIRLDKEKEDE